MVAVSSRASFVQETTTTTGAGTYDLAGAVTGFQGFVAGNGDGAIVRYSVTDGTNWEVCEGTITDAATDTLSRGTVLESSNAGAAVNWGAGTKTISQVLTPGEVCGKFPIETITLASPGEFDFDSIPSGYKRLIIEGYARGDVSANGDNVYVFMNEDLTAANYHTQSLFAGNGSVFGTEFDFPFLGAVAAGTSPAGAVGSFRIVWEDYAGSNLKTAMADFMSPRGVDNTTVSKTAVVSALTAAITRIRIRADNHPTDQLTGELTLYGER